MKINIKTKKKITRVHKKVIIVTVTIVYRIVSRGSIDSVVGDERGNQDVIELLLTIRE